MRRRIDWLKEIEESNLKGDFEAYCARNDFRQHQKGKRALSRKRLARAFMLHVIHVVKNVNIWSN